jgi:hypothetical protein
MKLSLIARIFMSIKTVFSAITFLLSTLTWIVSLILTSTPIYKGADVAHNPFVTVINVLVITFLIVMILSAIDLTVKAIMTYRYSHMVLEGKRVEVGFKVCTIIFCDLVSGILMLCDKNH